VLDGQGLRRGPIYDGCEDRDCRPIIPLRKTPAVPKGDHKPPTCEHGTWTFAGADYQRTATKRRCPTGECKPASRWVKADRLHPLVPRESNRWTALYRGRGAEGASSADSRTSGRCHRSASVGWIGWRLHADLTILAKHACPLTRARAVSLAA
jgi:hypothetical protein